MSEESLVLKPTLKWNTVRGAWEKIGTESLLCGHSELFSQTWQTSGTMRNGLVYELLMPEPHTIVSECSSSPTLATPKARDWSPEGYEAGLRRGTPQLGTQIKALANGVYEVPEESMLRTPSAIEGQGGAISEKKSREKNRMLQVRDQMAQLAAENGLKVSDAIAKDLLPTPALGHIRNYDEPVEDYLARRKKMEDGEYKGMPGVSLGVAIRMETEPNNFSWGKFEPAIHRWEKVINRKAPVPTKPDGKEGSHRLSSKFTEWMMGVPDGWITDVGLSRVDELKACGNGVVPQQAELALRLLLQNVPGFSDL